MKKILLLSMMVLLLSGCGKKDCSYNFNGNMTDNYSEDAKKCSNVTYVDNRNGLEVVTTPTEDGKRFTMKMKYNNFDVFNSFDDVEFVNIKVKKDKEKNTVFIELYTDKKQANLSMVLLDVDGNLKFEIASTSDPIIDGDNLIVREYLKFTDNNQYSCKDYNNIQEPAYREVTYNIFNFQIVDSKDIYIKDICV